MQGNVDDAGDTAGDIYTLYVYIGTPEFGFHLRRYVTGTGVTVAHATYCARKNTVDEWLKVGRLERSAVMT